MGRARGWRVPRRNGVIWKLRPKSYEYGATAARSTEKRGRLALLGVL